MDQCILPLLSVFDTMYYYLNWLGISKSLRLLIRLHTFFFFPYNFPLIYFWIFDSFAIKVLEKFIAKGEFQESIWYFSKYFKSCLSIINHNLYNICSLYLEIRSRFWKYLSKSLHDRSRYITTFYRGLMSWQ